MVCFQDYGWGFLTLGVGDASAKKKSKRRLFAVEWFMFDMEGVLKIGGGGGPGDIREMKTAAQDGLC